MKELKMPYGGRKSWPITAEQVREDHGGYEGEEEYKDESKGSSTAFNRVSQAR